MLGLVYNTRCSVRLPLPLKRAPCTLLFFFCMHGFSFFFMHGFKPPSCTTCLGHLHRQGVRGIVAHAVHCQVAHVGYERQVGCRIGPGEAVPLSPAAVPISAGA